MRFIACFMVVIVGLSTGCSQRFLRVQNQDKLEQFMADIKSYNDEVRQLKASIDIKAQGVLGSFIHEQADIMVMSPHYLYWSLRSFFGPPSMILASDGEHITMFDFSGQSGSTYQQISLKNDSFFELMDFRFHPLSLVNLLLVKIPLDKATNININEADDILEITATLPGGWDLRSIFNHKERRVLETRLVHFEKGMSYQVKYDHPKESVGIYFPRTLVLFAKSGARFARFTIELIEVELNGEPILRDIFYLAPH